MCHKHLRSVKVRGKSPEAKNYLKTIHKPHVDRITTLARKFPAHILVWAPLDASDRNSVFAQYSQLKKQMAAITSELREHGVDFRKLFPKKNNAKPDALIDGLRKQCAKADLVFVLVSGDRRLLGHLLNLRTEMPDKLMLFIDSKTKTEFIELLKSKSKGRPDFEENFRQNNIFGFFQTLDAKVLNAVGCIQLLKYIREKEEENGAGPREIYAQYSHEVDVFMNRGHAAFLSLLRYLGNAAPDDLKRHTYISEDDIGSLLKFFFEINYVANDDETLRLTDAADFFFDLFDFTAPTLEQEKRIKIEEETRREAEKEKERQARAEEKARRETEKEKSRQKRITLFRERWMFHITGTYNSTHKLWGDQAELKKIFDDIYLPIARKDKFTLWFAKKWKSFFGIKKPTKTKGIWDNELIQKLFEIWRLDIAGPKHGPWAERKERAQFMGYVLSRVAIAYNPEMKQTYINHKNLSFDLKILRQNPLAHIYITNSFLMRPLKEYIRQYFNIAVITGEYELLLKRYPPYWNMLNMFVAPGDRTLLDLRGGLDIFPFTYRLDFNFNVAPDLRGIQSRRKDCFVSCPFIVDAEAEAMKASEVAGLEGALKGIFEFPSYLTNVDFDEQGNVVFLGGKEGKKEPLPAYGPRRANYIHTRDILSLTRANPRPDSKSGLIIRFNLADPLKVLLNGINGKRPVSLDEIIKLWKCIEIVMKPGGIDNLKDAIPEVFEQEHPKGVKGETSDFLADMERTAEMEGDEAAWEKLMPYMLEGRNKFLNQVICRALTPDGFEFVFSLWPLITGKTVKYDMKTMEIIEDKQAEKVVPKKADKMPLIDNLKREIEILLKNVFAENLDISGATAFYRSEPRLAGMIVELCLSTKESAYPDLKQSIRNHLFWHYQTHHNFLSSYLTLPIKDDDKLRDITEKDFQNILLQINETRNRLLSRSENNRLLRYIDQESINVQIGEFVYSDKVMGEIEFIKKDFKLKKELGELKVQKEAEVKKTDIEKEKEFELYDIKIEKLKHGAKWDRIIFEAGADRAVWDAGVLKKKDLDLHEIEMDKMRQMKMREKERDLIILKASAKRAVIEAEIEKDKHLELHEIREAQKKHLREWEIKIFQAMADHEIMEAEILKDKALDLQQIEMDQMKEMKMRERVRDMAILKAMAERSIEEAKIKKDQHLELHHIKLDEHEKTVKSDLKMLEHVADEKRILQARIEKSLKEFELDAMGKLRLGQLKELAYFSLLKTYQDEGSGELERILGESPNLVMAMNPEMHREHEIDEIKQRVIDIIKDTNEGIEPLTISMLLEQDPEKITSAEVYKNISARLSDALEFSRLSPPMRFPAMDKKQEPQIEAPITGGGMGGDSDIMEATTVSDAKESGEEAQNQKTEPPPEKDADAGGTDETPA